MAGRPVTIDPTEFGGRPSEPGSVYDLEEQTLTLASGEVLPFVEVGWDPSSGGKRATVLAGPARDGHWVVFEFDERSVN